MAVPLSVFSDGHRARICGVDPRPTATDHGLVEVIRGHEVQKAEVSEKGNFLKVFVVVNIVYNHHFTTV